MKKLILLLLAGLVGCTTKQALVVRPPPALEAIVGGYALSPTTATAPTTGGGGAISLTVPIWNATSDSSWLTVSPTTGTGNATLSWSAAANTGTNSRTGTLSIADKIVTITQPGSSVVPPGTGFVKRFGGTGSDAGTAVAVAGNGDIILAGYFQNSVDFGGGPLVSAGSHDIFLIRYTAAGNYVWQKRYGGAGSEYVTSIALDGSGNIFLGGYFYGAGNFGGSTKTAAGADAFVAKYSAAGDYQWDRTFGAASQDQVSGLATDSQGNIIATGYFQGVVDFGGITRQSTQLSVDAFLAKYSSAGLLSWVYPPANWNANVGFDYGTGVAVRNDDIFLTGYFSGSMNLGGGLITPAGGYIARFGPDGSHIWSKARGTHAQSTAIALDSSGNVGITGNFYQTTDLGNGTITGTAVDIDGFIAKYSGADGAYTWARPITGNQGIAPLSLTVDLQGNFVTTGYFYGSFNVGGTMLNSQLGSWDVFSGKYSSAGVPLSGQRFGGNGTDAGNGTFGQVTTGYFQGTANFAGTTLISAGSYDIFLMRTEPIPQ